MSGQRMEVLLTHGAEAGLESIFDYIAEFDSLANANRVLDRLLKVTEELSLSPERGSFPKELIALGIREYRQVFFKPHRIIEKRVYLIADSRRDLQSLLARRLLGA